MDEINYRLDRIDLAIQHLTSILERINPTKQMESSITLNGQMYYTLREAVKLKTGNDSSYTTFSTNRYLMPAANTNWVRISGYRRWPAEIIEEWLTITDQDIPEYCRKYGVELVGRQGEKYKKYMKEFKNER